MPIRSTLGGQAATAPALTYPRMLRGPSGSVWLVTGPSPKKAGRSTGVVVFKSERPQKAKHDVGYVANVLNEGDMRPFIGEIKLVA